MTGCDGLGVGCHAAPTQSEMNRRSEVTVSDPSAKVRLRPPRHRVERRAILWWTLQALLVVIPTGLGIAIAAAFAPPARAWLLLALVVVAVLGALYAAVMPSWRYRVHRWEATDEAVYTAAGWFNQEWRVAPMSRIQTVDTARGPLQQLLKLSSVTVTTASAAGPLTISGLDHRTAVELVERLTTATRDNPGDAT